MKNSPQKILSIVCSYYNMKVVDLKSANRSAKNSYVRQMYTYLSMSYTSEKACAIGSLINRDRTTVLYSYQKILKEKDIYKETFNDIEDLKEIILANKLIISHVDLLALAINYTNSFINV